MSVSRRQFLPFTLAMIDANLHSIIQVRVLR